jgi:hypothetical protein
MPHARAIAGLPERELHATIRPEPQRPQLDAEAELRATCAQHLGDRLAHRLCAAAAQAADARIGDDVRHPAHHLERAELG